ncbi:uncharacterized protein YndB with AHSA1/START domain [Arthrobacter sp. V4I6]|uniref:SRPBCC family protein n=1 Tax=unclassified Arthrobacter TaxID=235627 RepID=UPI002781C368|nr:MULTISPECIES: SRPBCC family protein [unclassified Arthrobacter]MDQ0819826.1 uncharacterized protein YndB with AHSA1/START domain [Arthrobacter sp. V1I7]MDQ0854005.1 uncharacterized protein YndB with AHSA1/START domain [Arthrobacter sp. V4I6]
MVDVVTRILIRRPRAEVADFAGDPDNASQWYVNIHATQREDSGPLVVGSRIAFTARFLARDLSYTYEIVELVPGERLVMRTSQGPFPMQTAYQWTDADGATLMTLRNTDKPSGFSRMAGPVMALLMRRAMRKDLQRLKAQLEARQPQIE